MKINIVCYEDLDEWICGKIAKRLFASLKALGQDVTLENHPVQQADINHHIIYLNYQPSEQGIHTVMVTHIDNALKLSRLKEALGTARVGICMSREGVRKLVDLGVNPTHLDFAHMGSDGRALPRRFVVGISTRLYPDGRKREVDFQELLSSITPSDFAFKIMGFGWAPIVDQMKRDGFEVEYNQDFDYEKYLQMMASLDYFLYLGADEGSAAFIDALAAGVKTIVQPQGFHLDAPGGITHPFTDAQQLKSVFQTIAADRRSRVSAVAEWSWVNYARKHLEIWAKCMPGAEQPLVPSDGAKSWSWGRLKLQASLWSSLVFQRLRMISNLNKDYECGSRHWTERLKRKRASEKKS